MGIPILYLIIKTTQNSVSNQVYIEPRLQLTTPTLIITKGDAFSSPTFKVTPTQDLFLVVLSAINNKDRRDAIRKTWMGSNVNVKYKFNNL